MASVAASAWWVSGGSRAPRTSVQMDEDGECDSGSPLVAVRQRVSAGEATSENGAPVDEARIESVVLKLGGRGA